MTFQQTNLFALLGMEEEVTVSVEDVKKQETAPKSTSNGKPASSKKDAPAAPSSTFTILADATIRYCGLDLPVTNYFSVEEIEKGIPMKKSGDKIAYQKITETTLRQKLEEDFPELVAGFTSIVYMKDKNLLVPVLQAKKKGLHCTESSSTESSFTTIGKIPFSLLSDFISIARQYSSQFKTEVHADIFVDLDKKEYFLYFPQQHVHRFWVEITEDPTMTALNLLEMRHRKIGEIHSHHEMAAWPSMTDNENERSSLLYVIVGKVHDFFPHVTARTFLKEMKTHLPLEIRSVFQDTFTRSPHQYDLSGIEVVDHD
ncbi:Mov34/MPN/PAD-1 family protein [Priestia koreensis]|uniref:Mov34/MPN/PAD-1 family protein n=1 Tax=Priestia koreensis TaxID=284581 RepID=UPI001F57C717|nr:Mov34/MPN/PAD-1 family protein [Priestia koreensis]UNL87435.1 Mov34/MPN/PAD-1 family protein [Priestia koreensis]